MNAVDDDVKEEIQLHQILDAAALTLLLVFLSTGQGDKSRLLRKESERVSEPS